MTIMLGRTVMVIPADPEINGDSFRGKIEWTGDHGPDEWSVRTEDGELTGPWTDLEIHADYPHEAGTLYDCDACEEIMEEREELS